MKLLYRTAYCVFSGFLLCLNAFAGLDEGLRAYYKLDGNALDETGKHKGTEHGNTYVTGMYGSAAYFNGINNYIDVDATRNLLNSPQVSFSYWIKLDDMIHEHSVAMSSYNGGDFQNGDVLWFLNSTNTFRIQYGTGSDQGLISEFKINFTSNEWVHICIILDSTRTARAARQKLYVNGIKIPAKLLQTNDTQDINIGNTSEIFRLGGFLGHPNRFMKGSLDEVRIYNRALTEKEIRQLALPNPTSLIQGYHIFDVKIYAKFPGKRDGKNIIEHEPVQGVLIYNGDTGDAQFFAIERKDILIMDVAFTYTPLLNHSVTRKGRLTAQGIACAHIAIDGLIDAVALGSFLLKETGEETLLTISLAGAGSDTGIYAYGSVQLRYNRILSNAMNLAEDGEDVLRNVILKKTGMDLNLNP